MFRSATKITGPRHRAVAKPRVGRKYDSTTKAHEVVAEWAWGAATVRPAIVQRICVVLAVFADAAFHRFGRRGVRKPAYEDHNRDRREENQVPRIHRELRGNPPNADQRLTKQTVFYCGLVAGFLIFRVLFG